DYYCSSYAVSNTVLF
nr:immunoglobulin light chain junction region [Macaca mulatta]MOW71691.1 immunoglobulin light chain junction region [Macaca mulatta]